MTNVDITAEPRSDFGKGAARRLRRSGSVPAVIYGTGIELTHVALDEHEINLALRKPRVVLNIAYDGNTYLTKPRDVQRDPVKQHLEHVDLVIITKQEAAIRSSYADAVAKAEIAAAEAGYDAASGRRRRRRCRRGRACCEQRRGIRGIVRSPGTHSTPCGLPRSCPTPG